MRPPWRLPSRRPCAKHSLHSLPTSPLTSLGRDGRSKSPSSRRGGPSDPRTCLPHPCPLRSHCFTPRLAPAHSSRAAKPRTTFHNHQQPIRAATRLRRGCPLVAAAQAAAAVGARGSAQDWGRRRPYNRRLHPEPAVLQVCDVLGLCCLTVQIGCPGRRCRSRAP